MSNENMQVLLSLLKVRRCLEKKVEQSLEYREDSGISLPFSIEEPVNFCGIRYVKLVQCPCSNDDDEDTRFNGYIGVEPSHIAYNMDADAIRFLRQEDVTYVSDDVKNGHKIHGFDTLHFYNKIPRGIPPVRYTFCKLMRALEDYIVKQLNHDGNNDDVDVLYIESNYFPNRWDVII